MGIKREEKTTMAANRMQRIFQLRSSEKSFVSRVFSDMRVSSSRSRSHSTETPCLPAIIVVFDDFISAFGKNSKLRRTYRVKRSGNPSKILARKNEVTHIFHS